MLGKKRAVVFVLVPLMLSAVLPAWGGGRSELHGQDIVVGQWWAGWDVDTFQPVSAVDHRILAHRRNMQREHGFRMREIFVANYGEYFSNMAISIMTGSPSASVYWVEPAWALTMQRQGLVAPINPGGVNLGPAVPGDGRVEWDQAMMNALTFGGQRYALSISGQMQPLVLFFNKRLFREAGIDPELPYNMQRDRTWTWANMLTMARQLTRDLTGDGMTDIWAFPRDPSTEFLDAVISSNGAGYVGRDAQGRFYNAIGRPEFLEALQFTLQLSEEGLMLPQPEGAMWDWAYSAFADGRVAMLVAPMWARDLLQTMTDDWGVVMFPMGPRVNDFAVFSMSHLLVIPSTFPPAEVQAIVAAVDLWFSPVDRSPYAWKDALWHVFRDARAVEETMAILRDPARHLVQYHRFIPGLERGHIAWQMWYHEGNPAQLIEAVTPSWNAMISDANN